METKKTGINATIVADSKSKKGVRLTTFVLTFPRIVLAEFNTHRVLSRNSASSRAIPFKKMLELVQTNPFIPIRWMKEHKGMQGSEYFTDIEVKELNLLEDHLEARDNAVKSAIKQSDKGLTKQVVNRYLEPFMWHTVIVTSSEWQNFFALRAHPAAEIHIADLAQKMLDVYNDSIPKELENGEWHIPFGDKFDNNRISVLCTELNVVGKHWSEINSQSLDTDLKLLKIKIATARCARISYNNFEGKDDYEADIKLHDGLSSSGHFSPFEHCSVATDDDKFHGNFYSWKQYRKFLPDENKKDTRVIQK